MTKYEDSLPLQLIRARDVSMDYFRPILADNEITEQQWRVMRVLDTLGEIDFSTLSRECCILGPSLTGIVNRLEKMGYVQRRKSANDGRKYYIHLTNKAKTLVDDLRPLIEAQYIELKAKLGEEKYRQLSTLLNALIDTKEQ